MARPENQHANIHFHSLGLAGKSAHIRFSPPAIGDEGSFRASFSTEQDVEFECVRLSEFARTQGHDKVDLLKLDIEGFEYEVLADVLDNGPVVDQLCVEFHHHVLPGIPASATADTLRRLRMSGFKLIYKAGSDYTFLRV